MNSSQSVWQNMIAVVMQVGYWILLAALVVLAIALLDTAVIWTIYFLGLPLPKL